MDNSIFRGSLQSRPVMRAVRQIAATLDRAPLWVIPLLISVLVFLPTVELSSTSDGLSYANTALNLYLGRGLVSRVGEPADARPLFPLLIAASFYVGGPSLTSAFLGLRIFFVLNSVLIYFLGKQVFNRWTGLVACLLVLTSSSLNEWSALLHLDHVLPTFLLLGLLLSLKALERQSYLLFAAAGLLFGMAFLVKELAMLFFPLPVLVFASVREYRQRKNLWGTALLLAMIALVILPWMVYIYTVRPQDALGKTTQYAVASATEGATWLETIGGMLGAFPNYYSVHLAPHFAVAPLLVAAWAFHLYRAVRGHKASLVLTFVLLLFSPMIVFQGRVGFRSRQAMFFFLISFVGLAGLLTQVLEPFPDQRRRAERTRLPRWVRDAVAGLLPIVAIVFQLALDTTDGLSPFTQRFNTVAALLQEDKTVVVGTGPNAAPIAQWLRENVPPGSGVLGSEAISRPLYFESGGDYALASMPFLHSDEPQDWIQPGDHSVILLAADRRGNNIVQGIEFSRLSALTEQSLYGRLREASLDYVLIERNTVLIHYLMDSPNFVKVGDLRDGRVQFFKVLPEPWQPTQFEPIVDEQAVAFLETAQREDRARYEALVTTFFGELLGWTEDQVLAMADHTVDALTPRIRLDDYIERKVAEGTLEAAIDLHQRKAAASPESPWPPLTLAALYGAAGDQAAKLDQYQRAVAVAPGDETVAAHIRLNVQDRALTDFLSQGEDYHRSERIETRGSRAFYASRRLLIDPGGTHVTCGALCDVRRSTFVIEGEPRGILFQHAPAKTAYRLCVPGSSRLAFGLALSPEVWHLGYGDGVQFDVYLEDGDTRWRAFSTYLDPKNVQSHRGWQDREIDLSLWAGQAVTLALANGPGPSGNSDYDWAGWGEPRILQEVAYDFWTELPNADAGGAGEKQVRQDTLTIDDEPRKLIFQHPPSRITYRLDLPEGTVLHFGLGIDPSVWSVDKGDGIEFNVYVRDPTRENPVRRVFHRYLDPKHNADERRWLDAAVDLSAYGGRPVEITFETLPGPNGDDNSDWGGWSVPVLVIDGTGGSCSGF